MADHDLRQAGKAGAALCAQVAIAMLAIVVLGLAPPSAGAMLVASAAGAPVKPWLDRRTDIRFVGPGRLPGSIVVMGDRNAILPDALAHGALLLPALPIFCSQSIEVPRS